MTSIAEHWSGGHEYLLPEGLLSHTALDFQWLSSSSAWEASLSWHSCASHKAQVFNFSKGP